MDCIFCAIAAGEAAASRVLEDDRTAAFLDVQPVTEGHTLIIPKRHVAALEDVTADDATAMFATARLVAGALRASDVRAEGLNLLLADGAVAGQEVFHLHLHLHVFARHEGDGFRIGAAWGNPRRDELDRAPGRFRGRTTATIAVQRPLNCEARSWRTR